VVLRDGRLGQRLDPSWVKFFELCQDSEARERRHAFEQQRRARRLASASLFVAVLREEPPHPMWRFARVCVLGLDRVLNGLHTALLIYYTSLGMLAFPLLATAHHIGGAALALVGGYFGFLALERFKKPTTPAGDDSEQERRIVP
jgi:hypothetical protein